MIAQNPIQAFLSGIHNRLNDELIPKDAASSSYGWLTRDGKMELMYGREALGAEGAAGKVFGVHTAYNVNGTAIFYRKTNTTIQYLLAGVWTDVITGLVAGSVSFVNYFSLSGTFLYIYSPQGLWKIHTANPGSFADVFLSTKNFKAHAFIDQGRAIMWGIARDKTGLYGSFIDRQDSTVYTVVAGEATTSLSGTLAFKAAGARRTCFAVVITITAGGQVFTDNYDGTLTGSSGGTGTINYMTGAYTLSASGVGTAGYQWEDSSAKGVTDFSKSATRLAGEGFIIRQDAGGDEIKVVVPHEGNYFSFKQNSIYRFLRDAADTDPLNEIFRADVGVDTLNSAVATSLGVVFMNTASATRASLDIVERNVTGDNFLTNVLFPHFDFTGFVYDDVVLESWNDYLLVACKSDSGENNRLIMGDVKKKTIDVAQYGARSFTKDDGRLYIGDSVSQTVYELFTGFDDMGIPVANEFVSMNDTFGVEKLKKSKKLRFRGLIDPNQKIKVSLSIDNSDWQHVGTIAGSADYVDYLTSYAIGTNLIGGETLGGGDTVPVYQFLMEIKIRTPKYRKRRIKLEAEGFGYCAIQMMADWDIYTFPDRLPRSSRLTQNVSLDGTETDQPTPTY